jgi:predicted transcriptional regulator
MRYTSHCTMASTGTSSQTLSLRLGDEERRALEDIARTRGITRAEAARQAITETAERERRRFGLAAEVARLAADPADRAARERVAADMDSVAVDWPE